MLICKYFHIYSMYHKTVNQWLNNTNKNNNKIKSLGEEYCYKRTLKSNNNQNN